jgi:hypothetical protein
MDDYRNGTGIMERIIPLKPAERDFFPYYLARYKTIQQMNCLKKLLEKELRCAIYHRWSGEFLEKKIPCKPRNHEPGNKGGNAKY